MRANKFRFSSLGVIGCLIVSAAYAQQPLLQIVSPANQSLAPEGQAITITVSADLSVQNIWLMTQSPLPEVQPTGSATQFILTLPTNIPPGLYRISAIGSNASGPVASAPIQIDVERQDAPVSLAANPTSLAFLSNGDTLSIDVEGTFADGSTLSITNSSQTLYFAANSSVVTVAPNGYVTAVGPGQSSVTARYGSISTTLGVTVAQPPPSGPAPNITGISPTSGTAGVTPITITGYGFGGTQGNGSVQLGNMDATSISSWSDGQIVATVPVGATSGVAMVEQNGLYSNEVSFTILGSTGSTVVVTSVDSRVP